jgi:hypothetical protein
MTLVEWMFVCNLSKTIEKCKVPVINLHCIHVSNISTDYTVFYFQCARLGQHLLQKDCFVNDFPEDLLVRAKTYRNCVNRLIYVYTALRISDGFHHLQEDTFRAP